MCFMVVLLFPLCYHLLAYDLGEQREAIALPYSDKSVVIGFLYVYTFG